MKKQIGALFAAVLMPFSSVAPNNAQVIPFSDDEAFTFTLNETSLKIVQFTDLHLTYGFDKHDRMTFDLIKKVSLNEKPDLLVFSGDQTMSLISVRLYKKLISYVEKLEIPWTFIFGNHDYDFVSKARLLRAISSVKTTYLHFKVGPDFKDHSAGNFVFNYYVDDTPFYNLYFLDSKDELKTNEKDTLSKYAYFSEAQVNWYKEKALRDQSQDIYSTIFMHIPLPEYLHAKDDEYKDTLDGGDFGETVAAQGRNTGFFSAMQEAGKAQAVFVGHDHLNNFTFNYEGVLLAYGQASGYNGYGRVRRGARIINITGTDSVPLLRTNVIYGDTL